MRTGRLTTAFLKEAGRDAKALTDASFDAKALTAPGALRGAGFGAKASRTPATRAGRLTFISMGLGTVLPRPACAGAPRLQGACLLGARAFIDGLFKDGLVGLLSGTASPRPACSD
eukprot:2932526-Heterocapsa_arctica.AAC.1